MKALNAEQQETVNSSAKRMLIVAGAGSGKTHTLCHKIAATIASGIAPEDIVVITFTTIAARELERRLGEHIGKKTLGFIGTLHAWALHNIRRHAAALGYRTNIKVLDEQTATAAIKKVLEELRLKSVPICEVQSEMSNRQPSWRNASVAAKKYLARLRGMNCVDYTAMLSEFHRLITSIPAFKRPRALFVDEYQDSATEDAAIYDAIDAEYDCRIGDPDQSMYSFRGGKIENILALGKRDGWQVFNLATNYRSVPKIVEAANRLMAGAPGNPYRKPMQPIEHKWEGSISVTSYRNWHDEACSIAERIARIGSSMCAVLTRYNARADFIRDIFKAQGITINQPPAREDHSRIIAALRALACPDDDAPALPWLQSVEGQGIAAEAAASGITQTRAMLRRLGVERDQQLGEQLNRMLMLNHEIITIRDAWTGTLSSTADALELEGSAQRPEDHACHVGTVHSFKGAERSMIFLAGWEQETTPGGKGGAELDEERRIAYVAATRAQQDLAISWCQQTMDSAGRKVLAGSPSNFITTLA